MSLRNPSAVTGSSQEMETLPMKATLLLLLMLLGAAVAFAQTASVAGIVTDASQAIVTGATITITNLDSGLRREVRSNETGAYTFTQLPDRPVQGRSGSLRVHHANAA